VNNPDGGSRHAAGMGSDRDAWACLHLDRLEIFRDIRANFDAIASEFSRTTGLPEGSSGSSPGCATWPRARSRRWSGSCASFLRWLGDLTAGAGPVPTLCLIGPSAATSSLSSLIRGMLPEVDSILTSRFARVREVILGFVEEHGRAPRLVVIEGMPHDNVIATVRLATIRNDGSLVAQGNGQAVPLLIPCPAFVLLYNDGPGVEVPGVIAKNSTVLRVSWAGPPTTSPSV
jgi:hypothetical protein